MTKYVIINRNIIASNKKHGRKNAPISVRKGRSGKPEYHSEFEFNGPARLVYKPDNPLKCGATVWLEIEE